MIDYTSPEEHRDALAREFEEAFKAKYDKGQAEHGGRLWRKNCAGMLLEEVLDFWAYARTMEAQRQAAVSLLQEALSRARLGNQGVLRCVMEAIALLEGEPEVPAAHEALARSMRARG